MKTQNFCSRTKNFNLYITIALVIIFALPSCEEVDTTNGSQATTSKTMEVVDVSAQVSTLKTAIDVAGLRTTLNGDGPFTVFAPTNSAFAKADTETLEYLLATPSELEKVLQYHVVSGKVKSTDLTNGNVSTLNGDVMVNLTNGVQVNNASVTSANIMAANGIIHLINEILLPENLMIPEMRNIFEIAQATPRLSTLVEALVMFADLVELLSADGKITVFAPDSDAFTALLSANGQSKLTNVPKPVIKNLLQYHVITSGKVMSTDLVNGSEPMAASGEKLMVQLMDVKAYISESMLNSQGVSISIGEKVKVMDNDPNNTDATVIQTNIKVTNGVIHVIDQVLIPAL